MPAAAINAGSLSSLTRRTKALSNASSSTSIEMGRQADSLAGDGSCISAAVCTMRSTIQFQHEAEKRFLNTGTRDVRDHWQIDGRQHRLARAVADHLFSEHHLFVALRNELQAQVEDAVQRIGWTLCAGGERAPGWRSCSRQSEWAKLAIARARSVVAGRGWSLAFEYAGHDAVSVDALDGPV